MSEEETFKALRRATFSEITDTANQYKASIFMIEGVEDMTNGLLSKHSVSYSLSYLTEKYKKELIAYLKDNNWTLEEYEDEFNRRYLPETQEGKLRNY